MGDPKLPLDVLHIIASELAEQQEFSALYRCAISGSIFAKAGTIQGLYRKCNYAPIIGGGTETTSGDGPMVEQESTVQRWSILWRSIILSSLGKAMFPYCHFLRVLDLKDLMFLLDDDRFRGNISTHFFSGDLAHLNMTVEVPRARGPRRVRLDTKPIMMSVADAITKQAIKLQALHEPVSPGLDLLSDGLSLWSPRLRHLEFLQLGDGKVLGDFALQDLLVESCPLLTRLEIYRWINDDKSDAALARLFRRFAPNTIVSFQNERDCGIGPETCSALSTHARSLESLSLEIGNKGVPGLGALKACTNIVSLTLSDFNAPHILEATEKDVFADMIDWFVACTQLKSLSLHNFPSAPKLLTPAFQQSRFMLDYLEISGSFGQGVLYSLRDNEDFHSALGKQTQLRTLHLAADTEGSNLLDSNSLCGAVICMKSLKKLVLSRASDQFDDSHVLSICDELLELEELSFDPYFATDICLAQLSNLTQLKSVTFAGLTTFSFPQLTRFIESLGPGNTGLMMDIVNPVWESSLSEKDQATIKRKLQKAVDGTFIYNVRDPADAYRGSDSDSD